VLLERKKTSNSATETEDSRNFLYKCLFLNYLFIYVLCMIYPCSLEVFLGLFYCAYDMHNPNIIGRWWLITHRVAINHSSSSDWSLAEANNHLMFITHFGPFSCPNSQLYQNLLVLVCPEVLKVATLQT
jgi:hypothetical protein